MSLIDFYRRRNFLIDYGALLEYFLFELIEIEHSDIRQRLNPNHIPENLLSKVTHDSNGQ